MGYNDNVAWCDLYSLQVTGDPSPQGGTPTEVTVSFKFSQPFYGVFLRPNNWPWTVKLYAERYGSDIPPQFVSQAGTCNQVSPDYTVAIPVTLNAEGVYRVSAIVELDNNAGSVMGFSDTDVQISVWTAI